MYNFGIIGAGMIADFHACAIKDIENANLLGFFDAVPERAEELAKKHSCRAFSSLDDMLKSDEVDIITIATPSGAHMEPVIAAAEAGKHVICEKPMEITLERIDKMIKAHEKAGTRLGGVFQNRFNDAMIPLKEAIDSGRFGTITYMGVYVPWWRTEKYYKDSWHGTWKLDGGGALMNQSIHMIDMLCDLAPPIETIQASASSIGHPSIEAEDTAAVVLRFKGKALGIIYGTTSSFPGQLKRFEITGTKGTVVYLEDSFTTWEFADPKPEDEEIRKKFSQVQQTGGGAADPSAISFQNHKRNFEAFLKALDSGEEFALSGAEARKAVEIILAIYKSAKKGKLIKL